MTRFLPTPRDPAFGTVGLLFGGGQGEFDIRTAFDRVTLPD
ncbi:hypothetical protein [Streptomyces sp. 8N706]